jgi:ribosomal-protein-alanine N-acetyltransferase
MLPTERFFLKEIQPTDIQHIYKGLSDPRVYKYYGVRFLTLEATKEQMEWYEMLKETGTGIWFGIYDKVDNAFCGAGGYNNLEKEHQKAEIGFWLYPEYWGKGIMSEVMPKLLNYGFEELGLNRIEGFVENDNSKCKKALAKINFQLEGTMRQAEFKNGKLIDVDIYAKLKNQ